MKSLSRRTLLPALLAGLTLAACSTHAPPTTPTMVSVDTLPLQTLTLEDAFQTIWRPELRPAWRDPTSSETQAIQVLIPILLQAAYSHQVPADAAQLATSVGMRLERWQVSNRLHLVLVELQDQRRGAGAYLVSLSPPARTSPWLLWQAPHAYYDVNTGRIAGALYFNPPSGPSPVAFFTNTLHRYTQTDGKRTRRSFNPADACHNPAHLFAVATQAAAAAQAGATVIQLHGFAPSENDKPGGEEDDDPSRLPAGTLAVISGGQKEAPTAFSQVAASQLKNLLGNSILLFPTEASALGATTNVEMKSLLSISGSRFLHVEMVAELRGNLAQDTARREAVGALLFTLGTTE